MQLAWCEAEGIRQHFAGKLPSEIAELEGLAIIQMWMPERFRDMYCLDTIVLPKVLSRYEAEIRIAHCLGHHFLHDGNQVWFEAVDFMWRDKQEGEANEFAAWLLNPELRQQCMSAYDALHLLREHTMWFWEGEPAA
jgi:Zn-dependent peptidase ImmA (M78 family)